MFALNSALVISRLHALDNVVALEVLDELTSKLGGQSSRGEGISIACEEGRLYVNGGSVKIRRSGHAWQHDFLKFMDRMGLGGLSFRGEWCREAVQDLMRCIAEAQGSSPEERYQRIRAAAEQRIKLPAELSVLDPEEAKAQVGAGEGDDDLPDRERAIFYYARLLALAEATHVAVRHERSPDFHVRHLRNTLMRVVESLRLGLFELYVLALTAFPLPRRDPLAGHVTNVTLLSMSLGRLLGLTRGALADLGFAAFFHDLGRTVVSREADPEGEGEHPATAEPHIQVGLRCALRAKGYGEAGLLRLTVLQEHHRAAGEGYPASTGLRRPHLFSRVVALCDTFDRLEKGTPWAPPIGPAAALRRLLSDPRVEPALAEALRDVLGQHPRGTLLRSASGDISVVVDGGARRGHRPILRRLIRGDGTLDERGVLREAAPGDAQDEVAPQALSLDWQRAVLP